MTNEEKAKSYDNKVEPKFKIEKDKWYVCIKDLLDNYANKAFYKGDTYLSTQDGSLIPSNSNVPFEVVCPSTYFRDWTIEDAKDGDVLICGINKAEIGGDVEKLPNIVSTIFIFKNVITSRDYIHSYCHLYNRRFLWLQSTMYYNSFVYNIHPATKEQRDFLFQKIKEASYEWVADKKELKKDGKK